MDWISEWWTNRLMMDITHGALGNTSPHSLNGRLVTVAAYRIHFH